MKLGLALGVQRGDVVALVGAGGKTSALYRLAEEQASSRQTVIATTTTHVRRPPCAWPLILEAEEWARSEAVRRALGEQGKAFVAAGWADEERLQGLAPGEVASLASLADLTLVEADGARGRWLKAPAEHEPAIPPTATMVVPVVGLQALGQPLADPMVHRPERLAALLQVAPDTAVTPDLIVRLLLHPQGGLRCAPGSARVVPLLNQAEDPARRQSGRMIAAEILRSGGCIRRVAVGSVRDGGACECWQPTAVVVLAAGGAQRFGRLKQAEVWQGESLLGRAARTALASLATEVVVVLGCQAEHTRLLLPEGAARLQVVGNESWEEGQASSVRAGVAALPQGATAAIFMNADQPLLTPREIDALLIRHAETAAPIVAPCWQGALRSPALFGRPLFAELAALTGDHGGRMLWARHRGEAECLPVCDLAPYLDVDTPEDWQRLLEDRGREHG